jgi:hypothetical protein
LSTVHGSSPLEATAARSTAGRFRKRAAQRAATETAGEHRTTEDLVRRLWGGLPTGATGVQSWAEAVAGKHADTDPRVTEARRDAEHTHREQRNLAERHLRGSAVLRRKVLGSATPSTASTSATQWRTRAEQTRRDLAEIEALPITETAQLVRDRTARTEAERVASCAPRPHATREPPSSASSRHSQPATTGRDRSATAPACDARFGPG